MRYLAALFFVVTLSGCDHDESGRTNEGAADPGVALASVPPNSDTLKVTYSRSDPYKRSPDKKEGVPATKDHAGHDMKDMPGMDKKKKADKDMPVMDTKVTPGQEKKPKTEEPQQK